MRTTLIERRWARCGLILWGSVGLVLPLGLITSTQLHWSVVVYIGMMMWVGPLGATLLLEAVKNIGNELDTSLVVVASSSFILVLLSSLTCIGLTFSEVRGFYQWLVVSTTILQVLTGIVFYHCSKTPRPIPLDAYTYL